MSEKETKKQMRHEERKEAFYLLFEQIFRKDDIKTIIEDARDARDAEVGSYTKLIATGVSEKTEELDKYIENNLRSWKMNRISKVALAIMRIAVYEMLYVEEVPVSVSINEAIELAKEFATSADGSFVNGVLGSVAKQIKSSGD